MRSLIRRKRYGQWSRDARRAGECGKVPFMEEFRYEALHREGFRVPLFDSLEMEEEELPEFFRKLAGENPYSLFWEGCSSRGELEYALLVPEPVRVLRGFPSGVEIRSGKGKDGDFRKERSLEEFVERRFAASVMADYDAVPELPLFRGGYVGYFGHGMSERWEHLFAREAGRS